MAVQARTLEFYRQLDIADAVVAQGHKIPAVNLWGGRAGARVPFEAIGADLTPYPFLQIFPQDQHERLLIERLGTLGVSVERATELVGFTDEGERVAARIRGPDGRRKRARPNISPAVTARARRPRDHGRLSGGTYRQMFYVADVEAAGPAADGELHVDLDEADFCLFLAGKGRARLIGMVRGERADQADKLNSRMSATAPSSPQGRYRQVNWFSTYRVHHRVTEHFRKGRAFLLGDAAHIHSPAGGQGMNTEIGDAINLAWKLARGSCGQGARRAARQLRSRADRLRAAAGRNHRSRVQLCDRGWSASPTFCARASHPS